MAEIKRISSRLIVDELSEEKYKVELVEEIKQVNTSHLDIESLILKRKEIEDEIAKFLESKNQELERLDALIEECTKLGLDEKGKKKEKSKN